MSFLYDCYENGRTMIEGFDCYTPCLTRRFVENKPER